MPVSNSNQWLKVFMRGHAVYQNRPLIPHARAQAMVGRVMKEILPLGKRVNLTAAPNTHQYVTTIDTLIMICRGDLDMGLAYILEFLSADAVMKVCFLAEGPCSCKGRWEEVVLVQAVTTVPVAPLSQIWVAAWCAASGWVRGGMPTAIPGEWAFLLHISSLYVVLGFLDK